MRFYRYLNALSIDVVAGAVVCALFFAKLLQSELPVVVLVTLALAVWSVYCMDHLWDARRSPNPTLTFRHYFHKSYRKLLTTVLVVVLILGIVLFWCLPDPVKSMGFILTLSILIYFLTSFFWASKPVYHKELLIAFAYSFGVILGPFALRQTPITAPHLLIFIQFTTLAFSNLLLFSYFDTKSDTEQNFGSLSRSIGKKNTRLIIVMLLTLLVVTTIIGFLIWFDQVLIRQSQWVLALMTVPLIVTLTWQSYFGQSDRYRILGDTSFFIPLLIL